MGIGLALSGGGFRATLFHLGVVNFLRDAKLLTQVTHISSVSGGSILAAHMVLNWEKYIGDDSAFIGAADELLNFVKADIRGRIYRRLPGATFRRFIIPKVSFAQAWRQSATDLLKRYYSAWLYRGASLASLRYGEVLNPQALRPHLYLLTTNLTDGTQCSFVSEGFCNEDKNHLIHAETFPLADAVAASSAFPGLFPPVLITSPNSGIPESELGYPTILLTDGGVYDNLGVRKFYRLLETNPDELQHILVSDASARFTWATGIGFLEPLKTSLRAGDILTKRIHDLEVNMAKGDKFIRINISDVVQREDDQNALFPSIQRQIPAIRTDLDEFSDLELFTLIRHGYCVARAALKKSSIAINDTTAQPWDPVPKSKDQTLISLKQGGTDNLEEIRKTLSNSSRRKLRLVSISDRASRVHLSLLLTIVLIYFFGAPIWKLLTAPRRDELEKREIVQKTQELERQYVSILSDRREIIEGKMIGYISLPRDVAKVSVETWTTSQAAYALLKSSSVNRDDLSQIISAINERFDEKISEDWVQTEQGWYTRPGLKQIQAEPALWTTGAIALLLQRNDLDGGTRETLINRYNQVQRHLSKFYKYSNGACVFTLFARQEDPNNYSTYTTALALMMLLEARRADLPWGDSKEQRDTMIHNISSWLQTKYDENSSPRGWRGFDNPRVRNDVSEGFTLQVLSTLLEVEAEMNILLPDKIRNHIAEHLLTYSKQNGVDSTGRTFIDVIDEEGKKQHNESSIAFLWRPWAIRCFRLWLQRLDKNASAVEKLPLRNILHRLVLEEGNQTLNKNQNDYTFVSSETLIGLSAIK